MSERTYEDALEAHRARRHIENRVLGRVREILAPTNPDDVVVKWHHFDEHLGVAARWGDIRQAVKIEHMPKSDDPSDVMFMEPDKALIDQINERADRAGTMLRDWHARKIAGQPVVS